MRQRFWRAVFRYAAPRTGWARYDNDRDARMDAGLAAMEREASLERAALRLAQLRTTAWARAEVDEGSWIAGPETTTSTTTNGSVTWTNT